MPYIGNPVGGPKHKPQWAKDEDARIKARNETDKIVPFKRGRSPDSVDNMVARALWATELEVFLRRRVNAFMTLSTFSISFTAPIEAQEFKRLLLKRGRRK